MLTQVRLYGHLGRDFGRVHLLDVASPTEAARALRVLRPGFEAATLRHRPGFRVIVADEEIMPGEVTMLRPGRTIRIVPVVQGSGPIVGAVLMWGAEWIGMGVGAMLEGTIGAGLAGTIGAGVAMAAGAIGSSLLISGVSQLLFSPPKADSPASREAADNKPSYAFDGAVNTVVQGNPVQLIYGTMLVGSQEVSAGLFVEYI